MSEGSPAVRGAASSPATAQPESPGLARARFAFVFAVLVVLLGLAHRAAELKAWLAADQPGPGVVYYRGLFAYRVATVLLTLALCFYAFSRRGAPNSYWRAFWTVAYLAYLCHVGWTVFDTLQGEMVDLRRVVSRLGPDLVLTLWWGLDVVLAAVVPSDRKGCKSSAALFTYSRSRCSSAPRCCRRVLTWRPASSASA